MALLAPVAVLAVVVGLGVASRMARATGPAASGEAARADAIAVAVAVAPARTPWATLDLAARPTVIPFLPLMPFVADQREHGTDGLMGRLPFDLPRDDRAVPLINRFTIDDLLAARTVWDTTPPWVRRLGFLSGNRTDPDQP